ncbi:MAG: protein-L-isoaspartate(D-aspartate) O-methyltransferase [Gammaproteobacteria bacterium]|nr:protein-L-isoaspartate(D-aspartate) O-methyltransferase [Gammaproteobacteria bacterium]
MSKVLIKLLCLCTLFTSTQGVAQEFTEKRNALLDTIELDVQLTARSTGKKQLSDPVLKALREVPRHKFVRRGDEKHAYENRPLSIGYGQTISQPYIVAIMTELLDLHPNDKVLEIGTGSGYQAAILATIVKSVYTIEIIAPLAKIARDRLSNLHFTNIQTRVADGYFGWKEAAPFDAIVVTAAATHVPPPLVKQLKPGGKMIIPVGGRFFTQQLMVIEKQKDGSVKSKQVLPVSFVPLTGKH